MLIRKVANTMGTFERVLGVVCLVPLLVGASAPPPPEIVEAARRGDVGALGQLVEQGADVNAARGDGMTALHFAAQRGNVDAVEILLQAGARVTAATRIGAYTPLHLASRGGHVTVARSLVEAGADARAPTTNSGATPLHLAASSAGGGAELIALLVEHGADVNAREVSSGQTPLMFAAATGRAEAVTELLARGADPSVTTQVVDAIAGYVRDRAAAVALSEAIAEFRRSSRGPEEETGQVLRDVYANQGFIVPPSQRVPVVAGDTWRPTPAQVQEAIQIQREVASQEYVVTDTMSLVAPEVYRANAQDLRVMHPKLPERNIRVGRSGGMTALLLAAREGQVEAVEALADGGADVNQVSAGNGVSPLLIASLNGQYDAAMALVERGADPNLASAPENAAPLLATLQSHWSGMPNYPQPQSHHVQGTTHLELLEALLEAGADPNARLSLHIWYWEYSQRRTGITIRGSTPFFRAAFARDLDAMKLLVAYGADPHTPTVMTDELMRERRPPDGRQEESSGLPQVPGGAPHMYPIHAAAGGGFQGIGNYMMEGTPGGFMPTVKYLVEEHGADVNVPDSWGYTPLHYAAIRGDLEMIRYLVDLGADVAALTRLGMSPVDMTRGGQRAFFKAEAHPEAQALLEELGSPLVCLDLHYDGTGNLCEAAGTSSFEDLYGFPRTPLHLRPISEKFGWQEDEARQ